MGALGTSRASVVARTHRAAGTVPRSSVASGAVDAVNGAFMLMRRRALEEVGLFDEGYWMYMEDLDLCYRFAEAGWTTWYEPSVSVLHTKGGSSGRYRSARLNYAFHYGMYRFYRKHYAEQTNPALNLAVYAAIAGKLGVSLVRSAVLRRVAAVEDEELSALRRERGRARASRSGDGHPVSSHGSTSELGATKPVSALIVTWNNEATIADCIAALRRELPAESEILTFDNHSLDESARVAQEGGREFRGTTRTSASPRA